METRPERSKTRSSNKKGKSAAKIFRKILMCFFIVIICGITYIVYDAVTNGLGLPRSTVGITLTQPTQMNSTVPTTEPSETEPTETEPVSLEPEELAKKYFDSMSLEQKVWQMVFATPQDLAKDNGGYYPAGGVFFPEDTLVSTDTLSSEMRKVNSAIKTPVMFGVSEEGGSVAPLGALGLTDITEPMASYGLDGDVQSVYQLGQRMARQILQAGFHFNLAPVADTVNWYPRNVGDRSFSSDVNVAAKMVKVMVMGMQEKSLISCMKHFPNLGSTGQSNDDDISWRLYNDFVDSDFIPFTAGIEAGAEMIMVSNMMAPDLTGGTYLACCFSENVVTNILRNELGFKGVVLTDDQRGQTDTQLLVQAVQAGCDVVLMPADPQATVAAIMDAIENGTLTEERINESVWRILLLKCEYGVITQ